MYPNTFYRVSVKALIRNSQGHVLVVKENQDTWDLPGGGLDHGEDPKAGLARELREELGINDAVVGNIVTTETLYLEHKTAWLLWVVYEVKVGAQEFAHGEGVADARYIDPKEFKYSQDVYEKMIYSVCQKISKDAAKVDMLSLRRAIEVSWRPDTAYLVAEEPGNPALGQCYVTARVVQHYFPEAEIVEGEVNTGKGAEKHFWNVFHASENDVHIDLTWNQFPHGSRVETWKVRDRTTLNDSQVTIDRVERLLGRVEQNLETSMR